MRRCLETVVMLLITAVRNQILLLVLVVLLLLRRRQLQPRLDCIMLEILVHPSVVVSVEPLLPRHAVSVAVAAEPVSRTVRVHSVSLTLLALLEPLMKKGGI